MSSLEEYKGWIIKDITEEYWDDEKECVIERKKYVTSKGYITSGDIGIIGCIDFLCCLFFVLIVDEKELSVFVVLIPIFLFRIIQYLLLTKKATLSASTLNNLKKRIDFQQRNNWWF